MERSKSQSRRCAIYTRKSSEEGLEQDFNSLHAQREACEAFIKSQHGEGWWMGGTVALGYDVIDHRLVINPAEAETVKEIFQRYLELRSVRLLKDDLDRRGIISKIRLSRNGNRSGGKAFSRGALYELLSNPVHIGEIRHRKERCPGQHEPIVERELWEQPQRQLRDQAA